MTRALSKQRSTVSLESNTKEVSPLCYCSEAVSASRSSLCIDPSSEDFSYEIERLRLRHSPLHVLTSVSTAQDAPPARSFNVSLTLRPTDPDVHVATLCPKGLSVMLTYSYVAFHDNPCSDMTRFCRRSVFHDENMIHVSLGFTEPLLCNSFCRVVSEPFYEALRASRDPATCVYDAMNALDQCVAMGFDHFMKHEHEPYTMYLKKVRPESWTQQEQERYSPMKHHLDATCFSLQDALVLYESIEDFKCKWKKIAEYMSTRGFLRSPKECASQFLRCRDALMTMHSPVGGCTDQCPSTTTVQRCSATKPTVTSSPPRNTLFSSEQVLSPKDAESLSLPLPKRIILESLELKSILLLYASTMAVQVLCAKCKTSCVMAVKFQPHNASRLDTDVTSEHLHLQLGPVTKTTLKALCRRCSSLMTLVASAELVTPFHSCLARYHAVGLHLQDILPLDVFIECSSCSAALLCEKVFSGVRRSVCCSTCFTKSYFSYASVTIEGTTCIKPRSESTRTKKLRDNIPCSIKAGTSLPLQGTCKHYKKSFRWLRFPCCGQAFPCDVCHDTQSDHPCDWATRMICGYCSKEQAYSNKTCSCGEAVRGEKSRYWEGGRGCRNPLLMRRNDSKKYKAIGSSKKK